MLIFEMFVKTNSFLSMIIITSVYMSFIDMANGKLQSTECKMNWSWITNAILSPPNYKQLLDLCSKRLSDFDDMQHYQPTSITRNNLLRVIYSILLKKTM
ncbi:hypothetical protein QQG55_55045 [Brugia pahangi]